MQYVESYSALTEALQTLQWNPESQSRKLGRRLFDRAVIYPRTAALFLDFSSRHRPTLGPNCASRMRPVRASYRLLSRPERAVM